MLIDDIKKIRSEKKDLRNFGLTVGIVLVFLGGLLWWREKDFYHYFLIIGAVLVFAGLIVPSILKSLQRAWMTVAVIMGFFMTRVILSILFFLIITPMGVLSRLIGKDFLDKKINRDKNSYWQPKDNTVLDKSRYENQF